MRRLLFIAGYLVVIVAALVVERAARLRRRNGDDSRTAGLPIFDDVLRYIQQAKLGRTVVFVVWWWLGFHFLAR